MDSSANFAVQRILGRLAESEDITFVIKKLLPLTSKLIGNKFHMSKLTTENSRVSVVTAVIDASARTNVCCEETRKVCPCHSSLTARTFMNIWLRYQTAKAIYGRR